MTSTTSTGYRRALDAEARPNAFLEVHPVADLFPMLPDDELKDLAADITERGLLQPIVLDAENRILDGRNRYAACQLAGIEPTFTTYDGDDPDGYALAVNIARRNMTKGQQAMVLARAVFETNTDLTRDQREQLAKRFDISSSRIGYARAVVSHTPDLVPAVVAGTMPLDKAYETARERKRAAESTDTQMANLRADAPDLADEVDEDRLTLDEAMTALENRRQDVQRQKKVAEIDAIRAAVDDLIADARLVEVNGKRGARGYQIPGAAAMLPAASNCVPRSFLDAVGTQSRTQLLAGNCVRCPDAVRTPSTSTNNQNPRLRRTASHCVRRSPHTDCVP